ncbi:hypothetical protein RPC_2566 [Rhodopseudomonas palustris BisB18]|uniref:Uncharacterized protein n=1 Tax=Rhodopseudomonas palustris (strain BisB18) TaxID=316056 RepID=Q214S0_RHOPB
MRSISARSTFQRHREPPDQRSHFIEPLGILSLDRGLEAPQAFVVADRIASGIRKHHIVAALRHRIAPRIAGRRIMLKIGHLMSPNGRDRASTTASRTSS